MKGQVTSMPESSPHLYDISGTLSQNLSGKTVVIGVSASIAAIEIHRVARLLIRHGAQVQFVLTPAACTLVSPMSLEWCSARPVVTELTGRCEHLELFGVQGEGDLLLLAPMTANTLAKVALGLDDNALTTTVTTALGRESLPILAAPGMHEPMLKNPAVVRNLAMVQEMGIGILAPLLEEGKAKMVGAEEMVAQVCRVLGPGCLKGKSVLLTGGPTREFLDPARCLTNPSSGLTACLLAREAHRRGAEVHLVYGPGRVAPPSWIQVYKVVSSAEMHACVSRLCTEKSIDYFVGVAAVADFRPVEVAKEKIPSSKTMKLELKPTAKILDEVRRVSPQTVLVAFKASSHTEDEDLEEQARTYLESDRADWVVANSIVEEDQGFDSESNTYLLSSLGRPAAKLGPAHKRDLAMTLWQRLLERSDS